MPLRPPAYCCTKLASDSCLRQPLRQLRDGLQCSACEDFVPFVRGTQVPKFVSNPDGGGGEYFDANAPALQENILRWMFRTFQTEEESLRTRLISRLGLRAGSRVLVTGSGTCSDLPYIARSLSGSGEIYAQDLSAEMLLFGISRHIDGLAQLGVGCYFSVSDATNLPFSTDFFDAAYHFGGINLFSDRALAMAEMNRVVKQGGKIVIGDEGIAPWLVHTEGSDADADN